MLQFVYSWCKMLDKTSLERLGLREGRIRSDDFVHNGGWYNSKGEKIGWGDLSSDDINRLASNLSDDEVFVVLPEQYSFWKFVTRHGSFGCLCETSKEEKNPGQEYIIEHARYVITKTKMFSSFTETPEELAEIIKGGK